MINIAAHASVKVLKAGPFKNQVGTAIGEDPANEGNVLVRLEKDQVGEKLAKQVVRSLNAETEVEVVL